MCACLTAGFLLGGGHSPPLKMFCPLEISNPNLHCHALFNCPPLCPVLPPPPPVIFSEINPANSTKRSLPHPSFLLTCLCMHAASRNVSDWWLAYWISHTHVSSTFGTNISAYNITHSFSTPEVIPPLPLTHSPEYIPALPIVSASDNLAFYLGIYGGLAAANSVSWRDKEITTQF